jgi:hypothetical protein
MKRGRAQLDDELTALLRERDLEDATEALGEGGWKSVSRLKRMRDEDVGELGVPRGTARALEDVLRSLREAESKGVADKAARMKELEKEVASLRREGAKKDKRVQALEREAASKEGRRGKAAVRYTVILILCL